MNRKILYAFIVMLLTMPALVQAQDANAFTPPLTVYKDWEKVIETEDHTELSTRIVKCEKSQFNQIHLLFFNEANVAKQVKFKVEVTNKSDAKKISKEVSFSAAKFQMVFTDCSTTNPDFAKFKVDLPNDYDPNNLDIKITIL